MGLQTNEVRRSARRNALFDGTRLLAEIGRDSVGEDCSEAEYPLFALEGGGDGWPVDRCRGRLLVAP
jgi:hypothetical protein